MSLTLTYTFMYNTGTYLAKYSPVQVINNTPALISEGDPPSTFFGVGGREIPFNSY